MRRYIAGVLLAATALMIAVVIAACPSLQDVRKLPDMGGVEVARFSTRVAGQIEVLVTAALEEGQITKEEVISAADALDALANGPAVGSVSQMFDVKGWEGALLTLMALEIDAEIDRRGGYDEYGQLVENARFVVGEIASRLRLVAQ